MKTSITAKDSATSVVEISASALRHNLELLSRKVGPGVEKLAVVKANAYGHGAAEVVQVIQEHADRIGVATVSEAETVRQAGCTLPVLVFAPVRENLIEKYRSLNLTAVAGSLRELQMIDPDIDFHLEFDTGMGRLGFYTETWDEIQLTLKKRNLKPSGIMTHFATADSPGSGKVRRQLTGFNAFLDAHFPEDARKNLVIHAANSGGLLHYPDSRFDMVRFGLAMYGYGPDGNPGGLKPALRWKSFVAASKPLKKGMTVSYEANWSAPEDGYLVVVPVGYADGISRLLSNKIRMSVQGKILRQTGNVTMDYVMLFSTEPVEPGAEVEVMGPNSMNAQQWADLMGTIAYEVLCGIHPKIERVMTE